MWYKCFAICHLCVLNVFRVSLILLCVCDKSLCTSVLKKDIFCLIKFVLNTFDFVCLVYIHINNCNDESLRKIKFNYFKSHSTSSVIAKPAFNPLFPYYFLKSIFCSVFDQHFYFDRKILNLSSFWYLYRFKKKIQKWMNWTESLSFDVEWLIHWKWL